MPAASRALRDRFPQGSTAERAALVRQIRHVLGEHARLGALAPALTELYRTGWAAGETAARAAVAAREPAGLDKADAQRGDGRAEHLKEYWAHGEGAAKIRWGQPGDFDRCVVQLGKHVPSHMVKGLCANLHHRALGVWPGQEHAKADSDIELEKAFDPRQTRDWRGRWVDIPGAGPPSLDAAGRHRAPRRGHTPRPQGPMEPGGYIDPPTAPVALPSLPTIPDRSRRQIDRLTDRYGIRLEINNPSDPGVQQAIAGLSTIPDRHHELIDRALGQDGAIFITPGHPASHPLLINTPTGRWALANEPHLHGAWSDRDRELYLGGRPGADTTAVHEGGHAIDTQLGRPSENSSFRRLAQEVQQVFPDDYYRQPFPKGVRELFAQAYMAWVFNLGAPYAGTEIGRALEIPNPNDGRRAGDALANWFSDHLPI